ncbi:MAG: redox-sensing transcriptional repressor Rex [Actinomycetota bacterium]
MNPHDIPDPTVSRLSIYARCLERLIKDKINVVSSDELADRAGVNAAQVRKDLSYLGSFGRRGVGYETHHLLNRVSYSLGLSKQRTLVIVGSGKLGSALLAYKGFREKGFKPVAAFDVNKEKIGKTIGGVRVYDISRIREILKKKGPEIGIIAVPAPYAQEVANELVAAGIRSILNFAPTILKVPPQVVFRQVDLSLELDAISYYLNTGVPAEKSA